MHVLLVHEFGALDALSDLPTDTPLTLWLRKLGAPDLSQRIAEADLIAVAAATNASRQPWDDVLHDIATRGVPVALLRMVPSQLFDAAAISGSCSMYRAKDGSSEVACWIQQRVLAQLARLAEREVPSPRDPSGPAAPSRFTRFTFEGDGSLCCDRPDEAKTP